MGTGLVAFEPAVSRKVTPATPVNRGFRWHFTAVGTDSFVVDAMGLCAQYSLHDERVGDAAGYPQGDCNQIFMNLPQYTS